VGANPEAEALEQARMLGISWNKDERPCCVGWFVRRGSEQAPYEALVWLNAKDG
jgi:hypothetical protein